MDISFLSKKEEPPDEGAKKIEFARKLDSELGQEKKAPQPQSNNNHSDEANLLEEKETPEENFFSRLLAKFKGPQSKEGNNWSKDGVLEVNLVKGEIVKYFDWQKGVLLLFLAIFLSLAVLSFSFWGISWWGTKRQYTQNEAYAQSYYKIIKEIKDREGDVKDVLKFKHKLDLSNFLLQRHVYFTNFFNFLEKDTLSNVYFSSFSGDVNGNYRLSATTNNFDAINAQTQKFSGNPYVRGASVEAGSISKDKTGNVTVAFELTLSLDPKIFLDMKQVK